MRIILRLLKNNIKTNENNIKTIKNDIKTIKNVKTVQ